MAKTVQIRDLDDDVYDAIRVRAAELGVSVPEYLKRETERLASLPSMSEWVERTRRRPTTGRVDSLVALDELRGDWPA